MGGAGGGSESGLKPKVFHQLFPQLSHWPGAPCHGERAASAGHGGPRRGTRLLSAPPSRTIGHGGGPTGVGGGVLPVRVRRYQDGPGVPFRPISRGEAAGAGSSSPVTLRSWGGGDQPVKTQKFTFKRRNERAPRITFTPFSV